MRDPRNHPLDFLKTHKNKRLRLYFKDEARIGQKGRVCHIWWKRGERPPGLLDQRYVNAYIYAAIEPGTDTAFALILPDANGVGMQAFLDAFAETIAKNEHVALVLDGAGWHSSKSLRVPKNITLVPLPAYSPELNPVERVWLYLKDRFLSLRLHNDYNAIVAAASKAWKRLCRQTRRIASLTAYPWIMKVKQ
jgi:transposase